MPNVATHAVKLQFTGKEMMKNIIKLHNRPFLSTLSGGGR